MRLTKGLFQKVKNVKLSLDINKISKQICYKYHFESAP